MSFLERDRERKKEKGVVFSSPHKKTKKREKRVTKPTKTSIPPLLLMIFLRGKPTREILNRQGREVQKEKRKDHGIWDAAMLLLCPSKGRRKGSRW